MKKLFILLLLLSYQVSFCQFGVITDKDGYVNVRSEPKTDNNIIDTLNNGQIVWVFEEEEVNGWSSVDYKPYQQGIKDGDFKHGYIHKSRIQLIKNFPKVPVIKNTSNLITFQLDTISLKVGSKAFKTIGNKLLFDNENNKVLLEINDKRYWGTDREIPKQQYGEVTLKIGKKIIQLPTENLFEPTLYTTTVNIDKLNNIIYVATNNGDAAGSYSVLWIIKNGICIRRAIFYGF